MGDVEGRNGGPGKPSPIETIKLLNSRSRRDFERLHPSVDSMFVGHRVRDGKLVYLRAGRVVPLPMQRPPRFVNRAAEMSARPRSRSRRARAAAPTRGGPARPARPPSEPEPAFAPARGAL